MDKNNGFNGDDWHIKVLSVRHYKAGYEVRTEMVQLLPSGDPPVEMKNAYTPAGDYIGPSREAYRLCKVRGIAPERRTDESSACTIGFSRKDQKWYGWSHRAIFGFGIGYIAKEGTLVTSSGWTDDWLEEHPEEDQRVPVGFEAKTWEDCKRLAIAFADAV